MANITPQRLACYGLIAAAALLSSGCTAPQVCSDTSTIDAAYETFILGWQGLIFAATFVIFLVAGLAYMTAGVVNHRGVKLWAMNQIYEGMATLVLAMFFIGLVSWMCGLNAHVLGNEVTCAPSGSCSVFDVSTYYLEQFRDSITTAFYAIFGVNMAVAYQASVVQVYAPAGEGVQFTYGQGLQTLTQQMGMGMTVLSLAWILAASQILLLAISRELFGYLVVTGLVLRSFGVTRGFGGSLIAIAVGFFVVYPLMVVLMYGLLLGQVDNDMMVRHYSETTNKMTAILITMTAAGAIGGIIGNAYFGMAAATGAIIGLVAAILIFLPDIIQFIGTVIIGSLLIPFIVFMVVITFTKGLSAAIGEEVDVSNLTRLI